MTMDDQTQMREQLDDELQTRLDTYVGTLLEPDANGLARVRASVMTEAHARARAARSPDRGVTGWLGLFRRPVFGLAGAALLLLIVAGGAVAAIAESGPGGPLYEARLWLETVALPSDPIARADAQLVRLEDRLDEAEAGATSGNGAAVSAALEAYRETVDATVASDGPNPSREQHLESVLEKHRVVLQTLVVELDGHGNATQAIQRALDKNAETIDRIVSQTPAGGHGSGGPQPGKPGAGGQGQGGQGQGGPHASPPGQGVPNAAPTPSPTPSPSPKPGKGPNDPPGKSPKPSTP